MSVNSAKPMAPMTVKSVIARMSRLCLAGIKPSALNDLFIELFFRLLGNLSNFCKFLAVSVSEDIT